MGGQDWCLMLKYQYGIKSVKYSDSRGRRSDEQVSEFLLLFSPPVHSHAPHNCDWHHPLQDAASSSVAVAHNEAVAATGIRSCSAILTYKQLMNH